jgi:hypothetical protein
MVRGRIFLIFDIKPLLPPTLHRGSHVKLQIMCLSADRNDSPVIRPKRIYFPEQFCYCFSSNLCVLNTTNMD